MPKTPGTRRLAARLKTRQLETLVALARAGSLHRAAATLDVSQPALTKALRELEALVGRPLFLRSPQGLTPTAHGVVAIEHAQRLLSEVDALAGQLDAIDQGAGGKLRLGVIPYVSSDWLRGVVSRLIETPPPVSLRIVESATDRLLAELRARRLDCVVGRVTPANAGDDLAWRPVFEQKLRVVARAGHPLHRHGARLRIEQLAGLDWLLAPVGTPTRQLLDSTFIAAGIPAPQAMLETYSLPIIESFVASGDALAAVPDDIARQFERRGQIRALHFAWPMPPICVVWRADDGPRPLIRRFEKAAMTAKGGARSR